MKNGSGIRNKSQMSLGSTGLAKNVVFQVRVGKHKSPEWQTFVNSTNSKVSEKLENGS